MGDESRLDQVAFDRLFEDFQQQFAPAVGRFDVDLEPRAVRGKRIAVAAVGSGDVRIAFAYRVFHFPALERRAQLDGAPIPFNLVRTDGLARNVADHAFGQVHDLDVRGVGLVQLKHGEFRIMASAYSLIAEVAIDLVHALKPADHEALEVQLRCDAQEQIEIQRVVMRGERAGGGAAGDVMHHRCFHFQKTPCIQPTAQRRDDARALEKHFARLGIHDQINVTLTVALLDIAQTMPLVGQRTQRLREQAQFIDFDRQFAGFGAHQTAFRTDDVADIPALEGIVGVAQRIRLQKQLQAAGHILDLSECGFAHHPLGHEPAGDGNTAAGGFQRCGSPLVGVFVFVLQVARVVFAHVIVRERHALPAQHGEFAATLRDQSVLVVRWGVIVGHGVSAVCA